MTGGARPPAVPPCVEDTSEFVCLHLRFQRA